MACPLGPYTDQRRRRAAGIRRLRCRPRVRSIMEIRTGAWCASSGSCSRSPVPESSYDSLGMNGAHVALLAHVFNERHWAEQLQHRSRIWSY